MSLSREDFEEVGGSVVSKHEHPSDPDQTLVTVSVTVGGRTVEKVGKDEQELIDSFEPLLRREGRLS